MLHVRSLQLSHTVSLNISTQNQAPFTKRISTTCSPSSSPAPTLITTSATLALPTTTTLKSSETLLSRLATTTAQIPESVPASSSTPASPTSSAANFESVSPSAHARTSTTSPTTQSCAPKDHKLYPWLIVGIGNPGNKFQKTRHNVGFEVIDAIAQAEGIKLNTIQQRALTGKGLIGSTQVLLAKPQTYVNLTGQSVGPLAAYYRIPVQHILVIYDDMELEFGLMRLATKGGNTTNNGVKSVIEHLKGCRVFPRLRMGIGGVPGTMDPGAFVLQRFDKPEREEMDALITRAPVLIREMVTEGIEKTAKVWNEIRKSRMQLTPAEQEFLKRF